MAESIKLFLPNGEADSFCKAGWTGEITRPPRICPSRQITGGLQRAAQSRDCIGKDTFPPADQVEQCLLFERLCCKTRPVSIAELSYEF
jgi:hypothetical protein